jgi:RNA polymerase sigma-70 factor (ECF subfamily)
MTYHLIVDGSRLSKRESPLELAEFELNKGSEQHTMVSSLENKILIDALILAIKSQLTANQRHVIILRFAEGFNLFETAQVVGKEVGSVKSTQNRAIAKLRKVLDHMVSA